MPADVFPMAYRPIPGDLEPLPQEPISGVCSFANLYLLLPTVLEPSSTLWYLSADLTILTCYAMVRYLFNVDLKQLYINSGKIRLTFKLEEGVVVLGLYLLN